MAETVIEASKLTKSFRSGRDDLVVFSDLDLAVSRGESIALVGESGAGKSTLLHILGALDEPTSGEVYFEGSKLSNLSADELAHYRNHRVGYVWQSYHLLPEFTALENVEMPLWIAGINDEDSRKSAAKWLDRVGLGDRKNHQSGELSGGEQQRVAIARALATRPKLLLADEPTGNLDERNGVEIMSLLLDLPENEDLAVIIATHNRTFAGMCGRVARFQDGVLI